MIKANFTAYGSYVTDSLYQWDKNRTLKVTGITVSVAPEVHFTNVILGRAIVKQGTISGGTITAAIPNSLLQEAFAIRAYIGVYEGTKFKTLEVVEIPIIRRARPEDYTIETDEEVYSFKALHNRIENIIANGTSTEGNTELIDIRTDVEGTVHMTAGEAIRTQFKRIRKYGYMAEGELIIDLANGTIAANKILLLTSDRTFIYITSDAHSFDSTSMSVRSIYAVKIGNTYSIRLGTESNMNEYDNVYYIGGYYSKQLIGANFAPNLNVTIDSVTYKARRIIYNGDYNDIQSSFSNLSTECENNRRALIEYVYRVESSNSKYVEFFPNQTETSHKNIINGVIQDSTVSNRITTTILPSYNSKKIVVVLDSNYRYAANLFMYDENKNYISATYHTGSTGKIEIPIDVPYFSLMICRTSNEDLDVSELIKVRLLSVASNTTLEMIPDILLSDETTHIKLLGDSITQGMGSTGYIGYTIVENGTSISVRGNGSDYENKDENYIEGDYLGESGTRRWYESTSSTGWSNKLKDYFESKFNCSVKNYGMSGIDSDDLSTLCKNLVTEDDDIVILMIGTNDRATTTKAEFKTNVTNFVNYLTENNKKVVLLGSIPTSVENEADLDYHMEDINTILRAVARSCDVAFISVYDHFVDYCKTNSIEIDTLLKDGLHPNDAGYEVMFDIISKNLGVSVKRPGATW